MEFPKEGSKPTQTEDQETGTWGESLGEDSPCRWLDSAVWEGTPLRKGSPSPNMERDRAFVREDMH